MEEGAKTARDECNKWRILETHSLQYTYLVLVHLDVSSLLARLTVVTSPIIRIVRVSVSRPLSLGWLTGGGGIVCTGLSSVAQTASPGVCLGHTGSSTSGTSPTSALEAGVPTETVLAVGVWLRHTIHRHVCIGGTGCRARADGSANHGWAGAFGTILTPTALDWSAVDHLSLELDDSHRGVLVGVQFYESEATVSLHPDLGEVTA